MEQVEHYYTKNPKSQLVKYEIKDKVFGKFLKLTTASGMYSPQQIDKGSIVHLKYAKIKATDKVLDLGCGYGTVGILVKKIYPQTKVVMSEVNFRAVRCAQENRTFNKVKAKIIHSDGFDKVMAEDFNVVLFNPPINAGLKVCYRLIAGSFTHLKKGGTLQIVVRQRGGAERILKKMKAIFGNIKRIGIQGIYEVYLSKKETKEPVSDYDKQKVALTSK